MSARDSESGSSTYKGGSGSAGGLGNGGIGGGRGGGGNYGGGGGGGAGRNGGIGSRTGLTTGNRMIGGVARGRPGGMAFNPGAWGIRQSPVSRNKKAAPAVPGLLGPAVPAAVEEVLAIEDVPPLPSVQGWLPGWPGTGMWWGDKPHYMNNSGLNPAQSTPHWGTWADNSTAYGFGYDARTSPKSINDRVPIDPNFGGNTFDNKTGHVGTVGGSGRGWGGWNTPWN